MTEESSQSMGDWVPQVGMEFETLDPACVICHGPNDLLSC